MCANLKDWGKHGVGEYARAGQPTTASSPSGLLLKRLNRCVNEFAFRRSVGPGNGFETIGTALAGMRGRQPTYDRLTANRLTA